jgi:hypothetical protein
MADAINRIVPPSVSIDRAPQLGRERQRKSDDEKHPRKPGSPAPGNTAPPAAAPVDGEQDKGKNLDISA